jgi:site-specific DNA recombinase
MSASIQEASIPEQREWLVPAVAKDGHELAGEFEDEAIPGSEIEGRAGLWSMVAFCQQEDRAGRPIKHLYTWDTDRFSRATSIRTAAVLDPLHQAGLTHIHTPDEVIDLEDELDRVLFNLKQDLAKAAYAQSIGKNVRRSRLSRVREGKWPGGPAPLGYLIGPDGVLVVDEVWAPVVRWIFHRYITTADTINDICSRLNSDATVPKPPSGEWGHTTVHKILRNEAYRGRIFYGQRASGKYYHNDKGEIARVKGQRGKQSFKATPPGSAVVIEGAHEPLVTSVDFAAAAAKLERNRISKTTQPGRRGEWVLSSLVYCGECGRRMNGRTARHNREGGKSYVYRRYFCPGRSGCSPRCYAGEVLQDVLTKEIAALVKAEFCEPGRWAKVKAKVAKLAADQADADQGRRAALSERLAALDRDLARERRNVALAADDVRADVEQAFRELKAEREGVAGELASLDQQRTTSEGELDRLRSALDDLAQLEEVIVNKPPEIVRELMERVVEKVVVNYHPRKEAPAGKRPKRRMASITVTFRADVADLFTATRRCGQVRLILTSPIRVA